MVPRIKYAYRLVFLVFLLLFIYLSSGTVQGFSNGASSMYSLHEDGARIKSRKLLSHDAVFDYEDPGANCKHDPRGRKCAGKP